MRGLMLAGVWQKLKVSAEQVSDAPELWAAWQKLVADAQEPAGFNLPEMLLPQLPHAKNVRLCKIEQEGQLHMALPFVQGFGYRRSFGSELTASGLPHVLAASAPESVLAFLNAQPAPFLFRALPMDSRFAAHLQQSAGRWRVVKQWQRAALRVQGSFEDWLAASFDPKRRKEFKRQRNRLGEQGALAFETLTEEEQLAGFVESLLQLEAKGWKGKRGTAIAADINQAVVFKSICAGLFHSGALRFWQLTFNGQAIASLFGMVEGEQGWIVKIAHDEAFAKYSPGVLLILSVTEALFAEGKVKLVDSCAIPGHPMIDRIWRDRLHFADVLVAPASVSAMRFKALGARLDLQRQFRDLAKRVFYAVSRRKKS